MWCSFVAEQERRTQRRPPIPKNERDGVGKQSQEAVILENTNWL